MNKKLLGLLIFSCGAAAGSVVTWKLIKTKYEQIAQEEIDSVKAKFSKGIKNITEQITDDNQIKEVEKITKDCGYLSDSVAVKEESKSIYRAPYVIEPELFGECDDYDTQSLTYYTDGVLADDRDNVIEDVDGMVGEDSLTHFGEFEDDSVFVRNEGMRTDFEILLDVRKYSDVVRGGNNTEAEEQ